MRIAIGFAAGTLALFLATIWWAVASDREVWREITADTVLLRELEYPKAGATVADLGRPTIARRASFREPHPATGGLAAPELHLAVKSHRSARFRPTRQRVALMKQ
jgi:hypothetical protein